MGPREPFSKAELLKYRADKMTVAKATAPTIHTVLFFIFVLVKNLLAYVKYNIMGGGCQLAHL